MLEYLDEKGEWKRMDFVKEGNDWKMDLPGDDGPKGEKPGGKKKSGDKAEY